LNHGLSYLSYPALVDRQSAVQIQIFDTEYAARQQHLRGLTRLFILQLSDLIKNFTKNTLAPSKKMLAKLYQDWGTLENLSEHIVWATARDLFVTSAIYTEVEFKQRLMQLRPKFLANAQQHLALTQDILRHRTEVMLSISRLAEKKVIPERSLQDMHGQLAGLFYDNFIQETPTVWLRRYPIYLKAITLRVSNLARQQQRDLDRVIDIEIIQKAYMNKNRRKPDVIVDPSDVLYDFRWKIEELRISYFAQELKTMMPVSQTRLLKLLS
jgi:ATP-dependent helicase HrpA